ncbi:MAG: urease accessory protein [Myxococcaceae bacterium]|nr:urease accessory protein [Myxococcaceae bacterium]
MRADQAHASSVTAGTGTSPLKTTLLAGSHTEGLASTDDTTASVVAAAEDSWQAKLLLEFESRRGGTALARSLHEGPLRVQRPFYPEGQAGPCHVYVLHPPGGVVSGDRLLVDVRLGAATHALLTAPGANKLYRARADASASLMQRFGAGEGAIVEWLPPETIAFEGTRARVSTHVELAADATYAGWELLCLGRPAAGEGFAQGSVQTELIVQREGQLRYLERGHYRGGDPMLEAPWGMHGLPVLGTFLVASPRADASWVEAVREVLARAREADPADEHGGRFAVTLVSGMLIARYLGRSTREARALFERAYAVLRPLYAGLTAVHPRIWST